MEVIGAIASFIAIGQAIGTVPKIVATLRSLTGASAELHALAEELEYLHLVHEHMSDNIKLVSGEHSHALLKVKEPPLLQRLRSDLELTIHQLEELAAACIVAGESSKVSKVHWWKKRGDIKSLQVKCRDQRQ
ncbi:hypothetical protein F5Y19DRAFT_490311 [Xylariaceae sp. FL1651]|nr:hypothetical protein F5Y19DRAFT_490311 [Xylariaceae sp. FL1651]